MVHSSSTTLEELMLARWEFLGGIEIVGPAEYPCCCPRVKDVHLERRDALKPSLHHTSAVATVEYLSWTCNFPMAPLIHGVWCLHELKLGEKQDAYVLSLTLDGKN
ncbi:unnamed protein product [Urochloa humidicola]